MEIVETIVDNLLQETQKRILKWDIDPFHANDEVEVSPFTSTYERGEVEFVFTISSGKLKKRLFVDAPEEANMHFKD